MWYLSIEIRKNNLSKLFTVKSFLGQKSHWTIVSLDNCVIGQKSLGQLSPWTIIPWTIVATPFQLLVFEVETFPEYFDLNMHFK